MSDKLLDEIFSDMHDTYAKAILKKIEYYREHQDEDMPPSFMKEVREFLKDNHIDLDANTAKKNPVKSIAAKLPFDVVEGGK